MHLTSVNKLQLIQVPGRNTVYTQNRKDKTKQDKRKKKKKKRKKCLNWVEISHLSFWYMVLPQSHCSDWLSRLWTKIEEENRKNPLQLNIISKNDSGYWNMMKCILSQKFFINIINPFSVPVPVPVRFGFTTHSTIIKNRLFINRKESMLSAFSNLVLHQMLFRAMNLKSNFELYNLQCTSTKNQAVELKCCWLIHGNNKTMITNYGKLLIKTNVKFNYIQPTPLSS